MAKPPERPGRGTAGTGSGTGQDGRSRGRRTPYPTAEEQALFLGTMADAAPLPRRRRGRAPAGPAAADSAPVPAPAAKPAAKPSAKPAAKPAARTAAPHPAPVPAPPPTAKSPRLESGVAADLDRRTMDRLRKGKLVPEARLDLHGMTAAAAHRALGSFLGAAHATGKRCILVITGKGSLKEGGGVLRRELPHWLNAADNRPRVLGFAQARPEDGGGGAFYVLLKRKRAPATK